MVIRFFVENLVQVIKDVATAVPKSTAVAFKTSSGLGWRGVFLIMIIHNPSPLQRRYIFLLKLIISKSKRNNYTIFFIAVIEALSHSPTSSIGWFLI